MAFSPGDAAMPVYLLIASIFNSIFFYRSIKDVRSKEIAVSGAPSIALLLTAISEFVWVRFVPHATAISVRIEDTCRIMSSHDGDWAPEREASGCDVQGEGLDLQKPKPSDTALLLIQLGSSTRRFTFVCSGLLLSAWLSFWDALDACTCASHSTNCALATDAKYLTDARDLRSRVRTQVSVIDDYGIAPTLAWAVLIMNTGTSKAFSPR
eukprot:6192434-Pleurochrysis_carterae.AAC.2